VLLGRLRVREKLALLVLLPLIAVVATAVPLVVGQLHAVSQARRSADVVSAAVQVGTLVQQLQQERLLSLGYLATGDGRDRLVVRSAEVEDLIAQVRTDVGDRVSTLLPPALDTVAALDLVRTRVLRQDIDPDTLFTAYSNAIGVLIDAISLHQDANTATDTGRQELALDALIRHDEATSSAGAALFVGLANVNDIDARVIALVSAAASVQDSQERLFLSLASSSAKTLYRLVQEGPASQSVERYLSRVTGDPVGAVGDKVTDDLLPGVESLTALSRLVQIKIARDVSRESTSAANRAAGTGAVVIIVGLLLLALVVALSVLVAQAIAQPLRRLTASAEDVADVAQQELVRVSDEEDLDVSPPHLVPVQVGTSDELGELAAAFNRVQQVAAELVERQLVSRRNVATMFGNVGRRTQNLVGRQLAMIDTLERDEQDPAVLERLYRLDHVSTRLRRNANSLVVLSGAVEPSIASEPLSIADAIRSALGEIEGFQRVRLRETDEARLAPHAATDAMLLLAELLENSTSFSPPHTEVNVTAHVVDAGCRVTIVDHGIGMTDQQLAEENSRLVQRERLDLAPTDVLGLFVVGRLARRHSIDVQLRATAGTGVTAEVTIPRSCLVSLAGISRPNWRGLTAGRAEPEPDWTAADRNGHRPGGPETDLLESPVPTPAGLHDPDPAGERAQPGSARPGTRQISYQPGDSFPGHHPTTLPVPPTAFHPTDPSQPALPPAVPGPTAFRPDGPGQPGRPGDGGSGPGGPGQPGRPDEGLSGFRPNGPGGPRPGERIPGSLPSFRPDDPGQPGHAGPDGFRPAQPGGSGDAGPAAPSGFRPDQPGPPPAGPDPDQVQPGAFRSDDELAEAPFRGLDDADGPAGQDELAGFDAGGLTRPVGGPMTPVSRRVPGAQLPDPGPAATPSWSLRETPEDARKVVEAFESGVEAAEHVVPPPRLAEPAELDQPLLDRWERLRRRVPGSHLPQSPELTEPGEPPVTPDDSRALVEEFETGVRRALDNLAAVTARYSHTDDKPSGSAFTRHTEPAPQPAPESPRAAESRAADLPPMARRVPQPVPPPAPWPPVDVPGGRHATVEPPSRLADGPPAQPGDRPEDDPAIRALGEGTSPGPSLTRPYERHSNAATPPPARATPPDQVTPQDRTGSPDQADPQDRTVPQDRATRLGQAASPDRAAPPDRTVPQDRAPRPDQADPQGEADPQDEAGSPDRTVPQDGATRLGQAASPDQAAPPDRTVPQDRGALQDRAAPQRRRAGQDGGALQGRVAGSDEPDVAASAGGPAEVGPVPAEPEPPVEASMVRVVADEPRRRGAESAGNGRSSGRRNPLIRLNRRIPGAQLPDTGAHPNDLDPPPELDPDAARALVEEFEAGVARALGSAEDGRSSPGDPEQPGGTEGSER